MTVQRTTLVSLLALLAAGPALADCAIDGSGSVRILSNDFEALRIVDAGAQECASDAVTVTANATTEHKNIQVPALTANPAEYTVAMIANNSIVPLLGDDLIRPLDDLVAQYGQQLQPNQLIKIDGKIMAIAFMANGQHLVMRKDLLDQAGVAAPTSWEEVLTAAQALKDQGILETPLSQPDGGTWDLAAEFVNLYLGTGAEFFEPGTANLAIDNDQGRLALQTMRDMTQFMTPDYATNDTDATAQLYRDGKVAIETNWGSLAATLIDPAQAQPEVAENTVFAAAPTIGGGTIPAAALWWDGFAIAKNISDEDAAASFQAMMHAIRPEVATAKAEAAVWLIQGYQPGPAAVGVVANANGGARPYPMVPWMGTLHEVLGTELADFIKGNEDADKAIADITAAYTAAAQQAGYLQ
ncbi:Various polyols ABC transporter, periplasmic substrate-binding protein [Rubellimicrobium mesophilum DSM 19309]|uniref:Various polyols ABC transporter, periplasmic substrate-binding protein n=1 Tax=Rubellimicrobium mesophilum DSM 19309 TaxID=442562 RepID=A0A017HS43_9RHOB|nr:extracellular solute-binding protein [Rubellimicrobium mesophilum]EYD77206.1 Various polyols ABC transporter, periplasmic substrate-binding protein [Rubellimicrobium mesophilum DSM 19309]